MNERIKELIFEAVTFRIDPDSECYEAQVCPEDLEYLVESIVRECIKQAHTVGDLRGANDDMVYGADTAAVQISKYFGVEE
jgi:hypothetical protein